MKQKTNQKGFTIVELMIATLVFSTILLICSAGLIRIGRIYLRGVNNSRTQEATRNALDTISQTVQYAPEGVGTATNGIVNAVCFGGQQFTYVLDRKIVAGTPAPASDQTKHALVAHPVSGGGCSAPTFGTFNSDTYQGLELLGPNMQLMALDIDTSLGGGRVQITIRVSHGDDDLRSGGFCNSGAGSEFCSTAELSTIVQKRIQ